MPTYEYQCLDCRKRYEKREGFDALALQECERCGGSARRVIHAAPIVFKGSGFYVTDSRKSAPEAETEAKVESTSEKPAKSAKKDKDAATAATDGSSAAS